MTTTRPLLTLLALATSALAQTPPALPPPFATESASNGPVVIAQPQDVQLRVPPGFKIELAAEGFQMPRFMLLGASQEVLLSDAAKDGAGAVYVLRDRDHDGKIDEKTRIIEGLTRPYGLALLKDYLYVGEPESVKRWKYDAQSLKVVGPAETVVSLQGMTGGHWTRTLLFDRKGEKLNVTVGSGSNVDAGDDPRRAAVNRYNPDGTGHEIVATGLRNVIGLRYYPGTDVLWAATQERDGLGDDLVPDFLTEVKPGAFYGWPYAYIGPHEEPRRKGERPDLVEKTVVPDVILGSHVAVLDFLFYTGTTFPKEYQGGAFLAEHGSSNRARRVGYSVDFVPFKDGRPAGPPREFLSGFMLAPEKQEVWGRPVGLLQLADGSLLLSDDGGKKIWRISYGSSR
ncbi:MAG TPA: PQQ-dependent sugar dehydrogenase [Vicinamibacteria bacterium]|nr:PQQ-dependent sugar dehydrogenase [Vicinamibacteria bacterium]